MAKANVNVIELKGDWNEQRGKLKKEFPVLTDDDLVYVEGRKFEMLGNLRVKLGKTKEQLRALIESL
jgi:uncharacterized protein YjbJ (UPF0337 family)